MSGICTVTNPAAEFTVNLTRLSKVGENCHHKGSFHHSSFNIEFSVFGPLYNSSCPPGSGDCSAENREAKDLGKANAELTIDDGQLSLVYSSGAAC